MSPRSAARPDAAQTPTPAAQEVQAKDLCLRLLTDRARSRAELSKKLADKGYDDAVSERVLDRLTAVGLIDDAAFAAQWVHSRHTFSGKGKRALAMELRTKGVAPDVAASALDQIDGDDERDRATELVQRKLRTMSLDFPVDGPGGRSSERDRAVRKLVSMLARRGYPQGMAFDVVKTELAQAGTDTDGLSVD
ncbi:recombination regulator RecX [Rhodococcus spelaei]|uniref:Regulatory protein RecX n=1 Tax=Rhodococcus spelaei TaxID=2546320 RepID=A0A541AZ75_9NOCA|nr:recombination regulator RecX [Rhodococcus spelaei]TQF65366.1 recombination regulator RecX [Rhodococcus spelaei]